jgi:hypothetical protein
MPAERWRVIRKNQLGNARIGSIMASAGVGSGSVP